MAPFWPFFLLMLVHCLLYVPTISITNSIAFANLKDPQKDFADVSYVPKLVEELLKRGHSDEEIRGILGENFLRYLARVENARAK